MKQPTFVTVCFLLLVAPIGGCGLSSRERISIYQSAVERVQEESQRVETVMAQLEASAAEAKALLAEDSLPPDVREEILAGLEKTQETLGQIKPYKAELDAALGKYQQLLTAALEGADDIDLGRELELIGQGVGTIGAALPPPLSGWAALAGVVLTGAGGLLGALTKGKKDGKILAGVVQSVDKLLDSDLVPDSVGAKALLERKQSSAVREAVKKIPLSQRPIPKEKTQSA